MSTTLPTKTDYELNRMFGAFDRMFDQLWPQNMGLTVNPVPLDVFEKDRRLFVSAPIPGMKPEEVRVALEDGILTISGETKHVFESDPNAKAYRREMRYGKFARSVRVPDDVVADEVKATFENGMLTIELPRSQTKMTLTKEIPVRAKTDLEANAPK